MHLAYSAVSASTNDQQNNRHDTDHELVLRYEAYQAACDKYRHEIASIQKYLPGWMPKFR